MTKTQEKIWKKPKGSREMSWPSNETLPHLQELTLIYRKIDKVFSQCCFYIHARCPFVFPLRRPK